jgi:transcriptional regulator with XRE-family HTH domain
MEGMGGRMRARARELGWSDAEVARRLGLAQGRYANYVTDRHEPDLATLVRICAVLGTSADTLLGMVPLAADAGTRLEAKISASIRALDPQSVDAVSVVLDALVARSKSLEAAHPPDLRRRKRDPEPHA